MSSQIPTGFFSTEVKKSIYSQSYDSGIPIEGVQLIDLKNHMSDEGDFSELLRLDETGSLEAVPNFHLRQVNRTCLFPDSIKAWHVHQKQDEIWYISPHDQLFVGLWDVREKSKSSGEAKRLNLGGGISHLLFIPRGVAHGTANFSSENVELFYFVNQQFNLSEPDEFRIPWDSKGKEFWTPERD